MEPIRSSETLVNLVPEYTASHPPRLQTWMSVKYVYLSLISQRLVSAKFLEPVDRVEISVDARCWPSVSDSVQMFNKC